MKEKTEAIRKLRIAEFQLKCLQEQYRCGSSAELYWDMVRCGNNPRPIELLDAIKQTRALNQELKRRCINLEASLLHRPERDILEENVTLRDRYWDERDDNYRLSQDLLSLRALLHNQAKIIDAHQKTIKEGRLLLEDLLLQPVAQKCRKMITGLRLGPKDKTAVRIITHVHAKIVRLTTETVRLTAEREEWKATSLAEAETVRKFKDHWNKDTFEPEELDDEPEVVQRVSGLQPRVRALEGELAEVRALKDECKADAARLRDDKVAGEDELAWVREGRDGLLACLVDQLFPRFPGEDAGTGSGGSDDHGGDDDHDDAKHDGDGNDGEGDSKEDGDDKNACQNSEDCGHKHKDVQKSGDDDDKPCGEEDGAVSAGAA